MTQITLARLQEPYLLFLGDIESDTFAKTAFGLQQWCPELIAGQIRLAGCQVNMNLPELTITEAANQNVGSLVIGVTPIGGKLPENWFPVIHQAIDAGLDIVSGLHTRLVDVPEFVAAAAASGTRLVDVRTPPNNIPVANGIKRRGRRALMVGTDCAVGKKYSALALARALNELGVNATFRATGQTGIMIAGEGIAVDAVVADFISGAAELLSPSNDPNHWDVVEGQGSLFNPGFAGVTLGLIHGSQPDVLIMCLEATQTEITGWPGYPIPPLEACMQTYLQMARLTNADVRFAGLSINTSKLPAADRLPYLEKLSGQMSLPCVDPIAVGCGAIAKYINESFSAN